MVAPDPVDTRLLALIAEAGRAPVHTIAARLGMDVRDVAARLAALAATGLPLVVGVECDPHGIRSALAAAGVWGPQNPGQPAGAYPAQGMATGGYPAQGPPPAPGQQPGAQPGGHPAWGGQPAQQPPPGYPGAQAPGPYPGQQQAPQFPPLQTGGFPTQGYPPGQPFSGPQPAQQPGQQQAPQQLAAQQPGAVTPQSTWGPAQSAAWARGDQAPGSGPVTQQGAPGQQVAQPPASGPAKRGTVGSTLDGTGLAGERLSIALLEVVDPADSLFSAAGYRLQEGERAIVVHTELTNRGPIPFAALPDMYLVLVTTSGALVHKAPVSLSSRPPHRIGIQPGETAGGHTVYVLPDSVELAEVRWSPRPDDEQRTVSWTNLDS